MNASPVIATAGLNVAHEAHWLSDARVQAAAIIALATALKLAICPLVGLGTNESYAIASGRLMSLSYFDHPPLHFWLAHICEIVFGDDSAARTPFILIGAATSWMMFALTRRVYGARAGVWATLALNLSVFFNFVSGNWILPDGPLNFFLLVSAYALVPIAQGRNLGARGWIVAGIMAGLAALSKYHALLFIAGFFFFLITGRERSRALRGYGPWLALALAAAIFLPVIIWNASNDWVSLRFQGERALPHRLEIGLFFSLLSAQIAVLLPGAIFPLIGGTWEALKSRKTDELFFLWLGLPIAVLFTIVPLVTGNGMMHWSMPGWLLLLPLAGRFLERKSRIVKWPRRAMTAATVVMIAAMPAAALEYQTGWAGSAFPHLFRRGDPTAENTRWNALAPLLLGTNGAERAFVLTPSWRDAAKIDEVLDGKLRVLVSSNDPRNFGVGVDADALAGQNGWVVIRARDRDRASQCFMHVHYAHDAIIARNERPDAHLIVQRGDDFQPRRCGLTAFGR